MQNDKPSFFSSRRSFMLGSAAVTTGLGMTHFAASGHAGGPGGTPHRFVSLYLPGGWDTLLCLDPRDPGSSPSGIELGINRLAPEFRDPIEVSFGGSSQLLGSTMAPLLSHVDVLTVFRGANMNTVAHRAGQSYVNTYMAPSGIVAQGDSLGTWMAASNPYDQYLMPNVAIGVRSFNLNYPSAVTGIGVGRSTDVTGLMRPLGERFSPETADLLRIAQDASASCVGPGYPDPPAVEIVSLRDRVRELVGSGYGAEFDFGGNEALQTRYGIENANSPSDAGVIAATAFTLLDLELSTSVSMRFSGSLDTHESNWDTDQPMLLLRAFVALRGLLDDLRSTDPSLSHTTVVVHSEFGRTPKFNGRGGRDHWFANAFAVFGGGLRRGVFGATHPETLGLAAVDLETGQLDEGGIVLLPEHIAATLAHARGLPHDIFDVDPLLSWIDEA